MASQVNDERNPLGIQGIDHLLFYVGNAKQAAHYYLAAFGFKTTAYASLETGVPDYASYVLEQGKARIVVTSGLDPNGSIARHASLHGDSVRDIAFRVDSVEHAFQEAVRRGAHKIMEPIYREDEFGKVGIATVSTFGDTMHTFIDRSQYKGAFLPGYCATRPLRRIGRIGVTSFDHFAIGLNAGTLDDWVAFYIRVFGFHQCHEETVTTNKSGMRSKVLRGLSDDVVFPMMEPVPGAIRSQIHEYLAFHGGPGVQHAALRTKNIVNAVRIMVNQGVEFLHTPDVYYDMLPARVGTLEEDVDALRQFGVMVDKDESGYLFQVFTKAVTGRPTFFIELIQRKGSQGFGGANIRALFEAIERDQALRSAV